MIALDTNVVIRFLVNDDAAQAKRARALIEHTQVFIAPTVLLESEWMLRSAYGFGPAEILVFFRALLGLPGVFVADSAQVAAALEAYGNGLDFADALHLVLSAEAEALATFDATFIRRARRIKVSPGVIGA